MAQRNKYDIDERLESPFSLKHLKRSFIYIRRHIKKMSVAFFASIVSSILALSIPKILEYMLDHTIGTAANPGTHSVNELVTLACMSAVAIIISIFLNRLRAKLMTEVGQDIIFEIRSELFTHMQALPFSYYDNRPHGKILVRVVQYVNSVSNMLSNGIIDFILEIFNLVFIIVFMMFTSVRLSLVVLAGLPVLFIVMFSIKPAQRRAWQDVSNKNSNLNAYAAESINGMRITQIFTREKKNEEIFETLAMKSRKSHFRAGLIANLVQPAVDNISQIIFSFLYVVGILWVGKSDPVTFGVIFAMGNYSWRFWQPISRLSNIYNDFLNTIAYLERIFETMDEPILIGDAEAAYELPEIVGEVTFDHVTFGYDDNTTVLDDLSFTIKPGMSVALVGPTGAGKTTIVNLLSRFYDVTGGSIKIDGHDVSKVTLHSLRNQMGIMLQDSFIFSGTVAENIRYGRLDATQEEIEAAAAVVHVDEFVEKMEDRYESEIKENGGRLSQGQKQLLAFARTIIADPKILILDEATSSIDTKTELYVQEGINHLLSNRTSFIIAHRLSTIRECDRIMYIKDGGITEYGTHDELMTKRGDYYQMYTAQLLDL
ncbi:MAG: ABC transporter ATP-binding protein/permease [Oscillospiraceae bacterium]|jgi:ATP-binding cassette subfamily B protein|nr:ABC transporter ATP-binding protein/permease [Oscillospiraceae bacterium]